MSSNLEEAVQELPTVTDPVDCAEPSRRLRWFELSLVILVCFGSSIFGSIQILVNGSDASAFSGDLRWVSNLVHETAGILLLGYVLARRKLRLASLGLRWSLRDLGTGVIVLAVGYLAYWAGFDLIGIVAHGTPSTEHIARQLFGRPTVIAIPFILLNPFFEELIVRAYLMTEVRDLTGSWIPSIALSVLVQSSYHLYYGWKGAIALSFQFLIYSLYYARTRKITPIVVAHEVLDISAFMRLL